ncbi:hypothetical protein A3Q56_03738 [Intoshia linei]|uniref:Uncharacterized protein n=1 Tax=Intoshia linei TaxID=1819745 RepID=A0A177B4E7_9BILA|nr:hypothetical protein A3Q56_03738 [Intoshia linei]
MGAFFFVLTQTNLKELKIFVNTTLKNLIWDINSKQFEQIKIHLLEAIKNVLANIKWRFIDENGPRYKSVTKDTPFQWSYFKDNGIVSCLKDEETYMKSHGEQIMANNGWVMNDDPMRNFAGPNSWVYLRRELIPWGDNVKLNYGTGPADVPYLYDRMTEYIQNIASVFDGIRLDNCHSTPIHVCEYLLREARKQMCTNIYNYGGKPMGSFMEQRICLARESKARALLADQTHDNQPIIDKYNLRQFLPMMAVVSMVNNSICSNRGFDELVPYHIDVVTEKNMYQDCYYLSDQVLDLIKLRKIFNDFHMDISRKETFYNEIYTDEFSENIISIKRYDTTRHSSLVLLAHMDFSDNKKSLKNIKGCSQSEILKVNNNYEKLKKKCHYVYDIHETDVFHEILFEGSIDYAKDSDGFVRDNEFITGILDSNLYFKDIPSYGKSRFYDYKHSAYNKLVLNNFLPGSVMIFRLICSPPIEDHFMFIEEKIKDLQNVVPNVRRRSVSFNVQGEINDLAEYIDLVDLNYILFKADKEIETYDVKTVNNSVYNIPMYGPLIFSGLVGIESLLCKIRRTNDIGHAMCQNILKGCWLLDYIVERLNKRTSCADLGKWFECIFECIKSLPNHQLLPYFDIIIKNIVLILQMKLTLKMSNKISNGSVFLKKLAFSSVSFIGCQHDSTLPIPNKKYLKKFKRDFTSNVTLAAGFPHFTTGLFRMWGRDTCISIPGVLLITNRRELALDILMSFASVIYKGLVPNLIDGSGKYTRYNCRDASWFWLYSVRYYDETSKTSDNILDFYLIRKGIINILKNHAKGISFTEKAPNGDFSQLDRNMALEGFKIEAGVDWDTGFVYGGNPYNCGTWMDKMGESTWGNNKGRPSTPRNGSSIELVGLCYSALKWLNKKDLSRWKMPNGVNRTVHGVTSYISFYDWAALIKENFQKYFFIPYEPEMKEYVEAINNNKEPYILQRKEIKYEYDEYSDDSSSNESFHEESFGTFHPTYAKRFCMYIDTLNDKATSYKIRPNFFIAVVVATDLFDVEHIYNSVIYSAIVLLGTLGIKTLDKTDPDYRGSYDMQDSSDTNTACGFNYHQGPEWLWLTGYYCMARLITSKNYSIQMKRREYMVDALMEVDFFISRWHKHLDASEWKGVPELTNKQGEYCPHSCSSQLWSVATMMEAVLVYNEVRHFYKNFKIT